MLADIRSKVSSQEEILEAYLLRKRLTLPDDANPFFVLAYVLKGGFRAGWRRSRAEERGREPIDDALGRSIEIPGELMVGRIYRGTEIGQRVTSVEGGLIFRRD